MDKLEALKGIGLTDKEVKLYLACLTNGPATITELAKSTAIFRTYCYDIVKSLIEKGLVRYAIRSGVKRFEAVEPEKMMNIMQERASNVQAILPELNAMRGTVTEKPEAETYEGIEGIKTIHEQIIRARPSEVLVYGNTSKHYEVMKWYFPRYVRERIVHDIPARVITERSAYVTEHIIKGQKQARREVRFFPETARFPTIKYIYGDTVAMISLGNSPAGITVKNKDIADGERTAFEMMWKSAERR